MDSDHNGTLDLDEFVKGFEAFFTIFTQNTIHSLFRYADRDQNNTIDFKEFIGVIRHIEKKAYDDDPFVILFEKHDVNKNEVLEKDEFMNIVKAIYPSVSEKQMEVLFEATDLDGNGVIDFHEYITLSQEITRAMKNEQN